MRSGSVSTLGIDLTTCMDRAIGMAGLTTFGSPDIGVGDMAIKSGSTAIIECADLDLASPGDATLSFAD